MALVQVNEGGVGILEGQPGELLMAKPQDVTLIQEVAYSTQLDRVLLYPEQMTPRFFDLSSGEAGVVLDKLRRGGMRLAIVCAPGTVQFSSRFREILSNDLGVFDTRDDAVRWLCR
jgi:hypothetical protein